MVLGSLLIVTSHVFARESPGAEAGMVFYVNDEEYLVQMLREKECSSTFRASETAVRFEFVLVWLAWPHCVVLCCHCFPFLQRGALQEAADSKQHPCVPLHQRGPAL